MEPDKNRQSELYSRAVEEYGRSLVRLASGYEADPERRRDLSQEIHFQLWRSLDVFDGRCSLRTWVFRVAHNTAASHVARRMRDAGRLVRSSSAGFKQVYAEKGLSGFRGNAYC
ncbi:MAG: RNA polymerase sigma factor, partial [Bryobacteraceae bacterium]